MPLNRGGLALTPAGQIQRIYVQSETSDFTPAAGLEEYIFYQGFYNGSSTINLQLEGMVEDMLLHSLSVTYPLYDATELRNLEFQIGNDFNDPNFIRYDVPIPLGYKGFTVYPNIIIPQNAYIQMDGGGGGTRIFFSLSLKRAIFQRNGYTVGDL